MGPRPVSWFWLLGWICSPSPGGFLHLLGHLHFPHWPFCILEWARWLSLASSWKPIHHPWTSGLGSPSHLAFLGVPAAPVSFPRTKVLGAKPFPPYKAKPLFYHSPPAFLEAADCKRCQRRLATSRGQHASGIPTSHPREVGGDAAQPRSRAQTVQKHGPQLL